MKIGLFFNSFSGGGAERMMVNLARGLHDSGIEVIIYVVNKTGVFLDEVPTHIEVHDLNAKHGAKSILHKIRKILLSETLDVLISTQEHVNASVAIASTGIKTNTKIIFREANNPRQKKISTWRKLVNKNLYSSADHTIAVSEGVKESMINFYKLKDENISVIYNPVVDDSLQSLAKEPVDHPWFNSERDYPVIVAMGRFQPQKGFEELLEAFALVRANTKAKLVIFGDNKKSINYHNLLQRKIKALKLSDDVDLPGFAQNPFKYLSKASLFVLSSRHEGLPGVLIQAMACGCPVISTDCPSGPREILNHGEYGKLVQICDPKSLAEGITESLKRVTDTTSIKRRAAEFNVNRAVDSYLNVINSLTKNRQEMIE